MKKHNKSQFFKAPFSSLSSKNVISNFVFHEKQVSLSHKHYEYKLRSFLEGIKANKIKYNSLQILFEYEDNFKLICDIYKKYLKSKLELEILNFYLKSLSNFISLIHADEPMEELDKILNTVNKYLRVKQYNKNNILFRIGDYGTKYYILLKGKAYTLIPKKVIKYMTFEEYRNHLNILYIFGEDYLLEQTIHNNSQSLDISYSDIENDNNKTLRNIYLKYYTCNYEKYIKIINGDEHVMVQNYDLQDDESDNDTKNKEKNEKEDKDKSTKKGNNTSKNIDKKKEENKNDNCYINIKNEENKKEKKKRKGKYYKILKYFNENFIYKNRTNNIDSIYAQLESLKESEKNKNISENEDNYSNNSDNDNKRTLKKRLTRKLDKIREKNKDTIEYFQENDEIENIDDFNIGIPKQLLTKDIVVNTKAKYDGGELPSFFARDKSKYVYYEVTEKNEEENIENNYNKKSNLNTANDDTNNNLNINYYNNVLNLKRNLVIVGYDNVTTISSGMSFGELSLLNENHQRTSTIFIEEDSQIGRLNLSEYNSTIKTVRAKIRNDSINFLLSTKLFGDISFLFFMNKYWIYFQCKKAVKGEYLFNIGQKCETIYIIYSGDIKLNSYIDKDNIDDMIKAIKSAKIEKKGILNKIQNNLKKNSIFEKKQKFCLMIGKKGDILGLNDIVDYHTDKYICEGEIISDYLSYYEINRNILLSQISNNFQAHKNNKSIHSSNHNTENVGNFIRAKEEFMINKLNDIKNSIEHKVKFLDLILEKNSSDHDKEIKSRLNHHKKSLSSNHYNIEDESLKKTINNLIVSHQIFEKSKNLDKNNKSVTLNKSNTNTNLKFKNLNNLFPIKESDNSPFNKDKLLNLKNTITINPNLTLDIPSKNKKNKIILNNTNSKIESKQYENNNSIFDSIKMKNSNFFKPYEYPKIHDDNNSLKNWDITKKIKILKFPFLNNSNKRYFFNQNKKNNFINNYFMNTLKSNSKKYNNLININIENSSSSTSKNKYDVINSIYSENEKLNLKTEKNNKGNIDKTYFNNLLQPLNLTIKSARINPIIIYNKSNKNNNNEINSKKINLKIIIKNSSFNNNKNQNNNKSSNKNISNNKKLKNSMSSGKNIPFLDSIKKNYNFSSVKNKKFK